MLLGRRRASNNVAPLHVAGRKRKVSESEVLPPHLPTKRARAGTRSKATKSAPASAPAPAPAAPAPSGADVATTNAPEKKGKGKGEKKAETDDKDEDLADGPADAPVASKKKAKGKGKATEADDAADKPAVPLDEPAVPKREREGKGKATDPNAADKIAASRKKGKGAKIELDDLDAVLPDTLPQRKRPPKNVWKSTFMQIEGVPMSGYGDADLDNEVHPLFAEDKFEDMNYEVIRLSARLATKLLEFETLQPMFWTMLNHRGLYSDDTLKDLQEPDKDGDAQYEFVEPADNDWWSYGQNGKEHIRAALVNLVPMLRFVRSKDVEIGAVTNSVMKEKGFEYRPTYRKGCKSIITISDTLYQRLYDAHVTHQQADFPDLWQVRFDFGITMLHEVCHAFPLAIEGELGYEPFFPGSTIAEVGFEAEYRLFGGQINTLFDVPETTLFRYRGTAYDDGSDLVTPSKLKGVPVCWEWPYESLVKAYRGRGDFIRVRLKGLPSLDRAWRVRIEYFVQLFTNKFWNEHVPRMGAEALYPPKDVGLHFKMDYKGDVNPRKGPAPHGYIVQKCNTIVRSKAKKYQ